MRSTSLLVLFGVARVAGRSIKDWACRDNGNATASEWPSVRDLDSLEEMLLVSTRQAELVAAAMDRGLDMVAARGEVFDRVSVPLDEVPGGDDVAIFVTGQVRMLTTTVVERSWRAMLPETAMIFAVLDLTTSFRKGCRRMTMTATEADVRGTLDRLGVAYRLRLFTSANATAAAIDVALADVASGDVTMRQIRYLLRQGDPTLTALTTESIGHYGKLLLAYQLLRDVETSETAQRQFGHVVFLRPDSVYRGLDPSFFDGATVFLENDQFAVFPRSHAQIYATQLATIIAILATKHRNPTCRRWQDLRHRHSPTWGFDALIRGGCLHMARFGVVYSGLDVGLRRIPPLGHNRSRPFESYRILRLADDPNRIRPCLQNSITHSHLPFYKADLAKWASHLHIPPNSLDCGCRRGDASSL